MIVAVTGLGQACTRFLVASSDVAWTRTVAPRTAVDGARGLDVGWHLRHQRGAAVGRHASGADLRARRCGSGAQRHGTVSTVRPSAAAVPSPPPVGRSCSIGGRSYWRVNRQAVALEADRVGGRRRRSAGAGASRARRVVPRGAMVDAGGVVRVAASPAGSRSVPRPIERAGAAATTTATRTAARRCFGTITRSIDLERRRQ